MFAGFFFTFFIPSSFPRQYPPHSSVPSARAAVSALDIAHPQIASASRPYLGLLKYHLSEVNDLSASF